MVALLRIKLAKVSSFQRQLCSDMDLLRHLAHVKDEKQLESQKELMVIKEVKRNLNEKLIKAFLPAGFAEFFMQMEAIDFYDKPDYDRMIKLLERARDTLPLQPKTAKGFSTLVD